MQKEYCLKNVAEVISGYTFRTALEERKDGNVFVLQAKNILNDTKIDEENLSRINFEGSLTTSFVKEQDVIVSSRGNFGSGVIKKNLGKTIASSSVYIIRIKSENILADYLAVYLNSKIGQERINKKATGAVINTILRKDLESLKILIPSMEEQEKVIDSYNNGKKLEKLLARKTILLNNLIKETINNLIKN